MVRRVNRLSPVLKSLRSQESDKSEASDKQGNRWDWTLLFPPRGAVLLHQ